MLDQEFRYSTAEGSKPGVTILKIEGPFTLVNISHLQTDLRTLKPSCLIVDLAEVPYMDSAGLGVIMNAFVSAQRGGRDLIVANVNQKVRSLLEITRVDNILPVFGSVAEAESQA